MDKDYFRNMVRLLKETHSFQKCLSDYLRKSFVPINVSQVIILHFLQETDGKISHVELTEKMKGLYSNYNYMINNLNNNGYILKKSGMDIGLDNRCTFLFITEKGKELYRNIRLYVDSLNIDDL